MGNYSLKMFVKREKKKTWLYQSTILFPVFSTALRAVALGDLTNLMMN